MPRTAPSSTSAIPRPGRRERRRTETRERIFRAALKLFAERGFAGTTVEDITEAADVGKGTFFNYFPSKEHVLAAFGQMQVGKIDAALGHRQADRKPMRQVLRQMVHALAEEPGRSPALVRALLAGVLSSAPVRELMLANIRRGRELIAAFLQSAQKHGEVPRSVDPSETASGLQRMFFGTLFLWAVDSSEPLALRFDKAFDLFWAAVSSKEKRS